MARKMADFRPEKASEGSEERARRLHLAVEEAGGPGKVSANSGVNLRTLGYYLNGRDLKSEALAAIADACGVSVEWLATGRGPMRPELPPLPYTVAELGAPIEKSDIPFKGLVASVIDPAILKVVLEATKAADEQGAFDKGGAYDVEAKANFFIKVYAALERIDSAGGARGPSDGGGA